MAESHLELLRRAKSSWIYPIYVPSYSRAGKAPFLTLAAGMPEAVQRKVHIIVRPEERVKYETAYPWATIVIEREHGIGPARMRALLDADERGYERIAVLDDDIRNLTLLNRIGTKPDGTPQTQRHSHTFNGYPKPMSNARGLAAMCRLADIVFNRYPDVAYGAPRNGLFSNIEPLDVAISINNRGFPACVMLIDVARFQMRTMPKPFHFHGEDLAMFCDTLERGQQAFTIRCAAYDQHETIDTTIPLDPLDAVGRPHLQDTPKYYPKVHPYLRVSMKNKLGGVMRIGMLWDRWYKATGTRPTELTMAELLRII